MSDAGQPTRQLLLLGLEQADWHHLRLLVAKGSLRYFAELLSRSVGGPIAVPPPTDRVAQWTSLSTGKRAHQHGVYTSMCPAADGRGVVAASWSASAAPHLSEILCSQAMHVHQIGWPGASPAPPLEGIVVDQQSAFASSGQTTPYGKGRPWRHPPVAVDELLARRVQPADIDDVTLAGILPAHLHADLANPTLEHACRSILAETATLFRAARFALSITPWHATFCVFPLLRRLLETATEVSAAAPGAGLADAMLLGGYEYLDLLIGQLMQQVDSSTDLLLVGVGRQTSFGVLRSDHAASPWPTDASLLDVVPTTLTLFDLPTADDLPGKSWVERPSGTQPLDSIASWDAVACRIETPEEAAGDWPERPPHGTSPDDDDVAHLLELGYVDPVATNAAEEAQRQADLAEYHRALSLADAQSTDEAIAILSRLAGDRETWIAVGNSLAEVYLRQGRVDEAAQQLDRLVERGAESAQLYHLRGRLALASRDLEEAAQALAVAASMNAHLPGLRETQALLELRRGEYAAAYEGFREVLERQGKSAALLDAMAVCCLAEGELEQAADHALEAVACDSVYAPAHYRLGRVLLRLNRPDDARIAMTRAAEAETDFAAPYYWLARLSDDAAERHRFRKRAVAIIKNRSPERGRSGAPGERSRGE